MDFQRFFKVLRRYVWLLLLVSIATAVITYFLVSDLPEEYNSQALIAMGIADHSQQTVVNDQMEYFRIQQQFDNIIESITLKKNINVLSYKLILHDLENPEDAFNEITSELSELSPIDRQNVINAYKQLLINEKIITPEDNGQYKLYDYLESMQYGEKKILDQLSITRKDDSDFIQIDYLSNNPYLSVYVVNSIASDFVNSYEQRSVQNQNSSMAFLDSLLRTKEQLMDEKNSQIRDFQVRNSVINLGDQASVLYSRIIEKDAQRAAVVGEIQSLQAAIQGIDSRMKDANSELAPNNTVDNNQIVAIREQLQIANERYVNNNFQQGDARIIDSLQSRLSQLVASNTTRGTPDPRLLRQNLTQQKLTMEIDLDRAKSSLTVILSDLAEMRAQYSSMVPNDAGLKNYQREAEVATNEYLSALDMYNKNNVVSSIGITPQLVQAGFVNPAEPSKKKIFVGLSAVSSFSMCVFALAIAFLLDRKIRTLDQLAVSTEKRIIGQINNIVPNNKDLKTVWEGGNQNEDYALYKDMIRSLRFEIDSSLKVDDKKIIGVTSLHNQAGASFIASSLAYSFAMLKKRVLLIGGDYLLDDKSNVKSIKEVVNTDKSDYQLFDSFIIKRELQPDKFITKLTTDSKNESLLEIYNEDALRRGFEELRKEFDVIIIDAQSLQDIHLAKEWLMFVDRSIALFPAGATVGPYEKELISFINKQESFMGWVLNKTKPQDLGLINLARSN